MSQDVVSHIDILCRIEDLFFEMEIGVRLHESIDDHIIDCAANSMGVAIFEKLVTRHIDLSQVII